MASSLDQLLAVLRDPQLAESLAAQPDVWAEVKQMAAAHRFTGLLAWSTSKWLPLSEHAWRDRVLIGHHQQHQRFLEQLKMLLAAFRAEGIRCAALKGPLLAERFHAVPFLKSYHDLDLLVRSEDISASARLMQRLGFVVDGEYPWPLHRRTRHHLNFCAKGDVHLVELHYAFKAGPTLIRGDDFLERAVNWTSAAGLESLLLSPADEVFYLVIHAAGHAFHRLRWLYDALAAARSLDEAGRARVCALARQFHMGGYFVAADMATREFFGEAFPLDFSDFPKPWLWSRLDTRHIRTMAARVNYRYILRGLDSCRMSGTPASAVRLCLDNGAGRLAGFFYKLRGGATGPEVLARTIQDEG